MAVELRVRSPVLHVVHRALLAVVGVGRRKRPLTSAGPALQRRTRHTGPELEEPVYTIIGLTDAEREEMSRKVAEANKRSENGSGK